MLAALLDEVWSQLLRHREQWHWVRRLLLWDVSHRNYNSHGQLCQMQRADDRDVWELWLDDSGLREGILRDTDWCMTNTTPASCESVVRRKSGHRQSNHSLRRSKQPVILVRIFHTSEFHWVEDNMERIFLLYLACIG